MFVLVFVWDKETENGQRKGHDLNYDCYYYYSWPLPLKGC